jgi:protein-histidine pros-kinase
MPTPAGVRGDCPEPRRPRPGSARAAAQLAAAQFRGLLEAAPDAIVIADTDGRIVIVNRQAEVWFGYQREELLGQPVELLVPERFRSQHVRHRADYRAEPRTRPMGSGLGLMGRRKDGSEFPVEISLSAQQTDGGLLVTSVIRDVTERKQAEAARDRLLAREQLAHAAAETAQARYHGLFEAVADGVLVLGLDGRCLEANRAICRLSGYSADELRELRIGDLSASAPDLVGQIWEQLKREGAWHGELELAAKNGPAVPVEMWISTVQLPSGAAYVAAAHDISERRALERLQREFIAMVSHELMNPVTGIGLNAELLRLTETYSERAVDGITASARRLERLIGDLLDVSRLSSGRLLLRPSRVDLVEVARRCAAQTQTAGQAGRVRVETDQDAIVGWWDPVRLEQILDNLLSNALKYDPAGGEVLVRIENLGPEVRVAVHDRGPGISAEALPHLFDRFYRAEATERRAAGLGLGLHITKGLVEAHGGRITVESEPGRGSTFRFSLPRVEPADE